MESKELINRIRATDFYVSQVGRAVVVFEKSTGRELQRFEPPTSWGERWGWNVAPEGQAIVLTSK